jgi:AcrR family transcriptional regulator
VTTPGAILDAALHAFGEKGYAAATIDDVRERSGASVGSIYHHFGGKEQLAAALYVRALADYQDGFLAALRRHRTARAGVRAAVEHHVAWVTARPELARYLLGRSAAEVERASGGALRERNRAFFAAVQAWLAPHVAGGVLADLPLDVCSALWIGAAQEWSRQWLEGRVETPPRRAARLLADAAWQALKTKEDR